MEQNDRVSLQPDENDSPARAAAKQRIAIAVTAIVTSLTKAVIGAPSSTIYLALNDGMPHGMGLSEYNRLVEMLQVSDLIKIQNHAIRLTPKGRTLADALEPQLTTADHVTARLKDVDREDDAPGDRESRRTVPRVDGGDFDNLGASPDN